MKYKIVQNKKYHTYPNSGTVRSQALAIIRDLNMILSTVPEGVNVPPWVLMKISQASESVKSVENYIAYYGNKNNLG
mgnify:CR=1 FL=1|tara:strand:- start:233 stop:463 length:231 start_codon:yes stop_codon:yes gene_type:complete